MKSNFRLQTDVMAEFRHFYAPPYSYYVNALRLFHSKHALLIPCAQQNNPHKFNLSKRP
jgi:hypothetical protein